jgi:hypothetical protein
MDIARYMGVEPAMSRDLMERSAQSFFVDI